MAQPNIPRKPLISKSLAKSVSRSMARIMGGKSRDIAKPLILNIVTNISDDNVLINTTINPKGLTTVVSIVYNGLETTPVTVTETGSVSIPILELIPFTDYQFQIKAVNSIGETLSNIITKKTLKPLELSDGNWVGAYDKTYSKNVNSIDIANGLSELRDTRFDCELGEELSPDFDFNIPANWNPSNQIVGGKMVFTNVNANAQNYSTTVPIVTHPIKRIVIDIDSIVGGKIHTSYGSGTSNVGGNTTWGATTPGISSFDVLHSNSTPFIYIYCRAPFPATIAINSISIKNILGNHFTTLGIFTAGKPINDPINNYINFDGLYHRLELNIPTTIGTIYAIISKPIDYANFYVENSFNQVGFNTGTVVTLGRSDASTLIAMRLKKIWIRTVTDSAPVIAKLNAWIQRDIPFILEPEIPLGVLGTGTWNDDATHSDITIPITN